MSIDERTYIDISDLIRIRAMKDLLHQIEPMNSPGITEKEYKTVALTLRKWEKCLEEKMGVNNAD